MTSPAVSWQSDPPEQLLRERFGITTGFHSGQREIIEQLALGKRLLVIQRTGWGKSLCYQMASLYFPHMTIVFSPLKALMREQCQRCNEVYGIPAGIVSSEFSRQDKRATLAQAVTGKLKILYISPERLDNADWQESLARMHISMIVIDEAHCISTWGHDFRPHYRRIVRLLTALPEKVPVLALTATANTHVERDILSQIGEDAQLMRGPMIRPNLCLHVERLHGDWEKLCYLGDVLSQRSDSGIIYTATQQNAVMVAAFLQKMGLPAEHYHADREEHVKRDIEQRFMVNELRIVCSTNALGMGIDKPDIRFVIHYDISTSPIRYYQEIGRAGRDGSTSWCILLYDPADIATQEHLLESDRPKEQQHQKVLHELRRHIQGLHERDILLKTGLSEIAVRVILANLEDQGLLELNARRQLYVATASQEHIDLSFYETVLHQKRLELSNMQVYAQTERCAMAYLTAYLGGEREYTCGVCSRCRRAHFPLVRPSERIQARAMSFLEEESLPYIEECGSDEGKMHEAGWSLAYHGQTRVGKQVSASKYENAGPFPLGLVKQAVEVAQARYPLHTISGVVSVPPTNGSLLVERFARQVADLLRLEYLPVLTKMRTTQMQKRLTNRAQKAENVRGSFAVSHPQAIAARSLLLIDDIYDSGCTFREIGATLMQAGASAVYPLTITRTLHTDNR